MDLIILIVHLFLAIALIGLILLQKSEGGGLGMGGGGGMGGFMTARGAANLLTRSTAIVATLFIITSLTLAILASSQRGERSIVPQERPSPAGPAKPGETPKGEAPKPGEPAKTPTPAPAPEKK